MGDLLVGGGDHLAGVETAVLGVELDRTWDESLANSGSSMASWVSARRLKRFSRRTMSCTHSSGTSSSRRWSANRLRFSPVKKYVGERCSTVTCVASSAMAGTSVAAVAPEPITITSLSL